MNKYSAMFLVVLGQDAEADGLSAVFSGGRESLPSSLLIASICLHLTLKMVGFVGTSW